jgi:dCTP deaminase
MILTGQAIQKAYEKGSIKIEPFDALNLNPNSYNFRLAKTLLQASKESGSVNSFKRIEIPSEGFTLQPKILYLGATLEVIGSSEYVMTLLGRSSIGRLGLFLNITADLGHVGAISQWTLELKVIQPLRVYPNMRIGQISFWQRSGIAENYNGRYYKDLGPVPNKDTAVIR